MMHPMEHIKPLYIPPTKKWKGLTVFCYKCKTNVSEICKETGKPLSKCSFGDKHHFKVYVHVPGTDNERKTKKLETRDLNEAIKQSIEFAKEIKSGNYKINEVSKGKDKQGIRKEEMNRPVLLIHALARYIGVLNNEGVPAHMYRERSPEHIADVERSLQCPVLCLKENNRNVNSFRIDDIDDAFVGEVYTYLKGKNFSNRSWNKYLSHLSSFLIWYAKEYQFPIRDWFGRIKREKVSYTPESISFEEYKALQELAEKEIEKYATDIKPKRKIFSEWFVPGIDFSLETGRRKEEICNVKWSDIVHNKDGEILYITAEDYKVNRIQNRQKEESKKYIYIPVTKAVRDVLDKLGYEQKKNSEDYILAPNVITDRKKIVAGTLAKGFSYFYNQLKNGKQMTYRCLRKTFITQLSIHMQGGMTTTHADAKSVTGHSGDNVVNTHYIDKKAIAIAIGRSFKGVFSQEILRANELEQLRKETKSQTQKREL